MNSHPSLMLCIPAVENRSLTRQRTGDQISRALKGVPGPVLPLVVALLEEARAKSYLPACLSLALILRLATIPHGNNVPTSRDDVEMRVWRRWGLAQSILLILALQEGKPYICTCSAVLYCTPPILMVKHFDKQEPRLAHVPRTASLTDNLKVELVDGKKVGRGNGLQMVGSECTGEVIITKLSPGLSADCVFTAFGRRCPRPS